MDDHCYHVTEYVRCKAWPCVAIYTVGLFFLRRERPDYTAEFLADSSILAQKYAVTMLNGKCSSLYHIGIIGVRANPAAQKFRDMYNRYYPKRGLT